MSENVAAVAKHSIKSEARGRSSLAAALPVAALVLVDVILSLTAFILAYKLRHDTDVFLWRHRRSFLPAGVFTDFEPYLSFLFFVPIVQVYMLRRYGLYKLRGEFSFGNDLAKIFSATTLAALVLVLIAFLFRQGISYRDGHIVWLDFSFSRLVFVCDWLISIAVLGNQVDRARYSDRVSHRRAKPDSGCSCWVRRDGAGVHLGDLREAAPWL